MSLSAKSAELSPDLLSARNVHQAARNASKFHCQRAARDEQARDAVLPLGTYMRRVLLLVSYNNNNNNKKKKKNNNNNPRAPGPPPPAGAAE